MSFSLTKMKHLLLYGLHFHFYALVSCIHSSDDWITVTGTSQYQSLPACAQDCLLAVHDLKSCKSYGCVCSDSDPLGTNLIAGYDGVSSCVQACRDGSSVTQAVNAFKAICALAVPLVSGGAIGSTTVISTTAATTINGTATTATVLRTTTGAVASTYPTQSCTLITRRASYRCRLS